MDLALTYEIRRQMHKLLEERQAAEARVVDQVTEAFREFQASVVQLLVDWLWEYEPLDGQLAAEGAVIEAATGVVLGRWTQLRGQLHESPTPSGVVERAKHALGQSDRARVEREMEQFLYDLTTKAMANLDVLQGTRLAPLVQSRLETLNSTITTLWAEHIEAERTAVQTIQVKAQELWEAVAMGFDLPGTPSKEVL